MRRLAFIGALVASASGAAAQQTCGDDAWSSIGVAVFHCPGGNCAFLTPSRGWSSRPPSVPRGPFFMFSTEPWLRGIDRVGPAAGKVDEGDVLIAVNDVLITTPAGGAELARLDVNRDAKLTVRRGERFVHLQLRPVQTCGGPMMLVGSSVAQNAPPAPAPSDSGVPLIDFTVPQRIGDAVDQSLGMTLRCAGCAMIVTGGSPRWAVTDFPVIDSVVRGGVAWTAGLRRGDVMRKVNGRDVRSETGNSPILTPPAGDFDVEVTRRGAVIATTINRRIQATKQVQQRHVIRIERGDDRGWGSRTLGAFARFWKGLAGSDDSGPPARILVRGETWGPNGLGLLLRSEDEALFEIARGDSDARASTIRFRSNPVVAEVTADGPSARAGIVVGDAITHVNGGSVLEPGGAHALLFTRLDEPMTLTYVRGERSFTITITPMERR